MKNILRNMTGTIAALLLTANALHAQSVPNTVTITASAIAEQGSTTIGNKKTTPPPFKLSLTTKSFLTAIAVYETLAGHYAGPVPFPAGSKLLAFQTFGSTPSYGVYTKTNILLTACNDIMVSGRPSGDAILIHAGSFNTITGLALPSQTNNELYQFSYNDTAHAGSSQVAFTLLGIMTHTRTDTVPNATTLVFKETQTNKMSASAGDGSETAHPITITGSLSYAGSGSFIF